MILSSELWQVVEKAEEYNDIIIFGYFREGKETYQELKCRLSDKNIFFCDNDKNKQDNENVFSPEEAVKRFKKGLFIATSISRHEEMRYQLYSLGVDEKNIVFFVPDIFELRYQTVEMIKRITPLTELEFEVHIADHCNLNCINCTHFSPLSDEVFADYTQFESDMKRLSVLFNGKAKRIYLIGGEPLLNPEISKYMKCARDAFPVAEISVFTNGLLLEKMNEEFWEECRNSHIQILMTKYPLQEKIYEKIAKMCNKESVELSYVGGEKYVRAYSWHTPLDLEGKQNAADMFIRCGGANNCITLRDGKLYTCNTVAHIGIFNKYFGKNLEVCDDDGIDIYKANSKSEILSFLSKPIPFCRYCKVLENTGDTHWGISKKKIEEWT